MSIPFYSGCKCFFSVSVVNVIACYGVAVGSYLCSFVWKISMSTSVAVHLIKGGVWALLHSKVRSSSGRTNPLLYHIKVM